MEAFPEGFLLGSVGGGGLLSFTERLQGFADQFLNGIEMARFEFVFQYPFLLGREINVHVRPSF